MKMSHANQRHKMQTFVVKSNNKQLHIIIRMFFCIAAAGIALYSYIDKQNDLTELRLAIPVLAKEVKGIQEENIRLHYEIDRFESPLHLMELMRKPEFSHLKFPYLQDEIFLPKSAPLKPSHSVMEGGNT